MNEIKLSWTSGKRLLVSYECTALLTGGGCRICRLDIFRGVRTRRQMSQLVGGGWQPPNA